MIGEVRPIVQIIHLHRQTHHETLQTIRHAIKRAVRVVVAATKIEIVDKLDNKFSLSEQDFQRQKKKYI